MTPQLTPTEEQQKNADKSTIKEILNKGFAIDDAQIGKKNNENALFFNGRDNPSKNHGQDQWLYVNASVKQAETIAKAAGVFGKISDKPIGELVNMSFSDGKDRIDIKAVKDEGYMVKRAEDHPFLKDKKSLRNEQWRAEDLHAVLAANLLTPVQTYSYTSNQFPYELPEMELRNKGLVDVQRTNNGSMLIFDRPVTRAALGLDSLSPTPETESIIQKGKENEQSPQMTKAAGIINAIKGDSQKNDVHTAQSNNQNTTKEDAVPQKELSPILKQFYDLKSKHPDALLLFRCGDFYETYQQDAQKASFILGITLTRSNTKKTPNGKPLEMAGFPHHALDTYLPKLIRAGLRVAICDQLEDPKLSQKNKQKTVDHAITPLRPNNSQTTGQNTNQNADNSKADKTTGQNPSEQKAEPNTALDRNPINPKESAESRNADHTIAPNPADTRNTSNPTTRQPEPQQPAQPQNTKDPSLMTKAEMIDLLDKMVSKHMGINITRDIPIMAKTAKEIAFEVNRVGKEDDGSLRLYGHDSHDKVRSVSANKADKLTLEIILSYINKQQNRQQTDNPQVRTPQTQAPDDQTKQNKETPSLGTEAKKILALSKIHSAAKNNFPEDMVFIRVRDYETKRFMYQTFGEDAVLLAKKVSPSVELLQPEIKKQQYATATLQQGHLAAVKADMLAHNIKPVIINAKGEKIDNDHFLAFSKEELQTLLSQQQPIQPKPTEQSVNQNPNQAASKLQTPEPNPAESRNHVNPTTRQSESRQPDNSVNPKESAESRNTVDPASRNQATPQPSDNIQFDVHKNSHVAGIYDIRLFINGEKAGAHRLSKEDRDAWKAHKIPIRELMHKYFPELANVRLENLTLYKAEQKTGDEQTTKNATSNDAATVLQPNQNPGQNIGQNNNQPADQSPEQSPKQKVEPNPAESRNHDNSVNPKESAETRQPDNPASRNAENTANPTSQQPEPQQAVNQTTVDHSSDPNLTPKERAYEERAAAHQNTSDRLKQEDNQSIVLLQMQLKDGNIFYQTFNEDADFVANFLERKTLQSRDNKYISLTPDEVNYLKERLGQQNFVVEKFVHKNVQAAAQPVTTSQQPNQGNEQKTTGHTATPLSQQSPKQTNSSISITPDSRIEYTVTPLVRFNKETQQQERVKGMYELSISTEGQLIGRKTLSKEDRDLYNTRPGEITNIINRNFHQELQGVTVDFKKVHKPAVPDNQWNQLLMSNGMSLDKLPEMNRLTNAQTGKKYHVLTAMINGVTLGPKQMFHEDVNDFYDRSKPAAEIAAKVFRDELKNLNQQETMQTSTTTKVSNDDVIATWHASRYSNENADNPEKLAFVQRDGKFGVLYQTFNDDAKTMSKITNRSVRVEDTENYKNVVYANIPQDQILAVTRQLRAAGYQPYAINIEGMPVSFSAKQKESLPKSLSLEDGHKVENISLRNVNGQWLMSANLDGKPLPERELTKEDAVTFKQGQNTISDIVHKYYDNDFNRTQEETIKRGMSR